MNPELSDIPSSTEVAEASSKREGIVAMTREGIVTIMDAFKRRSLAYRQVKHTVQAHESNYQHIHDLASRMVAPVEAAADAILTSDDHGKARAAIQAAWNRIEHGESQGNTDPAKAINNLRLMVETLGETAQKSGETAGEEIPKVVNVPGMRNAPAALISSFYLCKYEIKDKDWLKENPDPMVYFLGDVFIREWALGEQLRLRAPRKGRFNDRSGVGFNPVDAAKVSKKEINHFYTKQRQASIIFKERMFAYRDIKHPNEPITPEMVIEAMLMGVLSTNKIIMETGGEIVQNQLLRGDVARQDVGDGTKRAAEGVAAKVGTYGNAIVLGGRGAIAGLPAFRLHNVDAGEVAGTFLRDAFTDIQHNLAEHGVLFALTVGAVLLVAERARRLYHPRNTPVDLSKSRWGGEHGMRQALLSEDAKALADIEREEEEEEMK